MPHFIIDCPEEIGHYCDPEELMTAIHDTADSTGLFAKGDIKVRIQPYAYSSVGNEYKLFIHIFGYIMQGRTTEQKAELSKKIVTKLKSMFPDIPVISMNVMDFEKASYCNRTMVD